MWKKTKKNELPNENWTRSRLLLDSGAAGEKKWQWIECLSVFSPLTALMMLYVHIFFFFPTLHCTYVQNFHVLLLLIYPHSGSSSSNGDEKKEISIHIFKKVDNLKVYLPPFSNFFPIFMLGNWKWNATHNFWRWRTITERQHKFWVTLRLWSE